VAYVILPIGGVICAALFVEAVFEMVKLKKILKKKK